MSDTPRTDKAIVDWIAVGDPCVYDEFARQLERELSVINEKLASAQKDAKRYRWLREQNVVPYGVDSSGNVQRVIVFWDGPVELDAAIDAAIAKVLATHA